jgi:hypothetical protein
MWSRRSVVATGLGALVLAGARRARATAGAGHAADRVELQELVQRERLARDLQQSDRPETVKALVDGEHAWLLRKA